LADCEVGKDLAIDGDARPGEPVDKFAVVEAEGTHRCVEALNPQGAKCALAALAVPIRILVGFFDSLFRDADGILAPPLIARGGLDDFLALGVSGDGAFDACHGKSPGVECAKRPSGPGSRERQLLGRKYFLILSPSDLNRTSVPRNWRMALLVRLIMPWRL